MKVLFPVDEASPLYKIGGLGDVGSALPIALTQLGVDVRIAMPKHPEIDVSHLSMIAAAQFSVDYGNETLPVTVYLTTLPGTTVPVYLFEENTYLSQHTDASDNHADKFAVFSLAVAAFISHYSPYWKPHIIHCHDWHTALIPVILEHKFHKSCKTIITIHNHAYQGVTTTPVVNRLHMPTDACRIIQWDQQDGDLNILMEGILHASAITTVSPTYAEEILTTEYGEHIEDIIASRKSKLVGITNGIDTIDFNPATDRHLPSKYDQSNWQTGKRENRIHLQQELGLSTDPTQLMIGFVGRVDPYQKGIGLIIKAIQQRQLPLENCQFVFLGTGDVSLEHQLHAAAKDHPYIRVITRFDEALARKIYAASHVMVIPSRFEPCGLVQLIAMRYGTLPIARATGGLKDTISHNETGFLFKEFSSEAFHQALIYSIRKIQNQENYERMVNAAFSQDVSWQNSAKKYAMLYEAVVMEN